MFELSIPPILDHCTTDIRTLDSNPACCEMLTRFILMNLAIILVHPDVLEADLCVIACAEDFAKVAPGTG